MVRPVARYRPGARRSGSQLEPVYFRTQLFTGSDSARSVQVYTGSQELIADFLLSEQLPAPVASESDPGFVQAGIDYVFWLFPSPGINKIILGTQWFGTLTNRTLRLFEHVVDDTLYCCFLRTSTYAATYVVSYALEIEGQPTAFNQVTASNIASSANYEIVTLGINLRSGAVTTGSSTLYTSGLNDITVRSAGTLSAYTRSGNYTGLKEAIAASLPSSHPFKDCGINAWSYLSNLHDGGLGAYSYTTPSPTDNPILITNGVLTGRNVAGPDFFNRDQQPIAARAKLDGMAGVNLASRQRVLRNGSVHELSSLSPAWLSCQGYSLLGAAVPDSFADYSPSNVAELVDLLDVSGLSQEDQDGITEAATSPEPPLTILAPETATGFETSEPTYFVSNNYRPSVAGSDLIRFYSTHYLIPD